MEQETPTPTTQKPKNKRWILWLLAVIILLLLLGLGYLWWLLADCQNNRSSLESDKQSLQSKVDELTKQVAEAKAAAENKKDPGNATCKNTATPALQSNIRDALTSKNTAVFSTYVTDPVYVIFAASEKAGNETPDQAALSMEYTHSAAAPWDFALDEATLNSYKDSFYSDYFPDTSYVGRSSDGMIVSFSFDCDGKIQTIFIAPNGAL